MISKQTWEEVQAMQPFVTAKFYGWKQRNILERQVKFLRRYSSPKIVLSDFVDDKFDF